MAQVTPHKFHSGQRRLLDAVLVPVFPAEGNRLLGDLKDTRVADGGARHIIAQVLERGGSGAGRLNMHAPIFGPDLGIDLPAFLIQQTAEVLPEGRLQVRQMEQAIGFLHTHELAVSIQPGAGNHAVDVRMASHALVPGMQSGGEAVDVGAEFFGGGELFAQRPGDGGKEHVVSLLGQGTKEATAQLGGNSKGDQEIRSIDQLAQFALNPALGGARSALGTGFVIAGMISEVKSSAWFAIKDAPAQLRGAAMGDGPNGAALGFGKGRLRFQKGRQKTAQRPNHGGGEAHDAGGGSWRCRSRRKASRVL